jgi:pyruvate/2-oxoglutarate dehydrogenase complex dihydrolipoamide dehydrogenase (E3) component
MAVDYDLVIIGGTHVGKQLAIEAASKDARVAWVYGYGIGLNDFNIDRLDLSNRGFNDLELGNHLFKNKFKPELSDCQKLGVDLIAGSGIFLSPKIFEVDRRQLSSRTFAIALPLPQPHRSIYFPKSGLESAFSAKVLLDNLGKLPRSLILIGSDSLTCCWAQKLNQLGMQITLLVDSTHILPGCDVEVVRYLQAGMETNGIQIFTYTQVNAIESLADSCDLITPDLLVSSEMNFRVWVNNSTSKQHFFEAEAVLCLGQTSIYSDLQLAAARVKQIDGKINLNQYLQTSNRRIYWCENHTDRSVVLGNSLFIPTRKKQYSPLISYTHPNLVSLGISEIDARLKYGNNLVIITETLNDGISKIICRDTGEVFAVHTLGMEAKQITETVAIAIKQKLKLQNLRDYPGILGEFAKQFISQSQLRQRIKSQDDFWWHWFNFRRDYDL